MVCKASNGKGMDFIMDFIQSIGEITSINLVGRLDALTAGKLMEELKTLEGKGVKRIDFYCADLRYISSAGIRAMVFSKQKIDKSIQMDIALHNASDDVKKVFEMSGLANYFEFTD